MLMEGKFLDTVTGIPEFRPVGCDHDADGNRIPVDVGAPPRTRAGSPAQRLSQ